MRSPILLAASFATALAQVGEDDSTIDNPSKSVLGCTDLPCASSVPGSICGADALIGKGVGFVPDAVQLPRSNTNLTLTLVDGEPSGHSLDGILYSTTRTLYVGAPDAASLKDGSPSCALTMFYDAATFPYYHDNSLAYRNTTTCPVQFSGEGSGINRMKAVIQDFRYANSSGDASSPSVGRCEALADYVEQSLRNDSLPYLETSYVSVIGSALSGPDVGTTAAQIIYNNPPDVTPDSCLPVLPQSYQLYTASFFQQPLRDLPESQNKTYGGRDGFTPIIVVVYDGDDDSNPDISLYCMHLWDRLGHSIYYSSHDLLNAGSTVLARTGAAAAVAGLVAGAAMLL